MGPTAQLGGLCRHSRCIRVGNVTGMLVLAEKEHPGLVHTLGGRSRSLAKTALAEDD